MATHLVNEFARDVRAGLSQKGQKMLPSKYLYDNVGSALFEAICALPEYGLTRADRFSTRHTRREIFTPGSSCGGAEMRALGLSQWEDKQLQWIVSVVTR